MITLKKLKHILLVLLLITFIQSSKMKTILRNIIKQRWLNYDAKLLGRWKLDYCDKKILRKLDMSNEDHCGPCGQYLISNSLETDSDEEKTNSYCFFIDIDEHRKI